MSERLGRYLLEEVIGVGSFATVHRAVDEALQDTVVIKILAENHSLNPEIRERFIAEGRSLRKVASSHVVGVHDIGENERQQPYLVLEHADRGTLASRVATLRKQGWTAGPADALAAARQLCAAIAAVHRANLVHRDLSPGNILLAALPATQESEGRGVPGSMLVGVDERLMVADLGMCKDLALNSGLTVGGGTAGFRPPEQDVPGMVDTRADLWAMSALLLWLCQGSGPEHGLPESFFTALRRSYAADPEERHRDVAAWLAEIEAALAAARGGEPPLSPGAVRPEAETVLVPLPAEARTAILDAPRNPAPSGAADVAGATRPPSEPGATSRLAVPPNPGEPGAPPKPAKRRWGVLAVALAFAVVTGLIGGWWLADSGPTASAGDAAIGIDGPEIVTVNEPVTFTAQSRGVASWVWSLPTGSYEIDAATVTLTAATPGTAVVVLRSRAPDGTELEVEHHFTVEE